MMWTRITVRDRLETAVDVLDRLWVSLGPQGRQTLSSGLALGEFDLFSPEGRWGMYCGDDERYSILGGDDAFMRLFLEKSGGIEAIQQRFYRFAEWMWPEQEYDGLRRDFWSLTGWKPPASLA